MPGWLVGIREKRAKQQAEQNAIKKKSSVNIFMDPSQAAILDFVFSHLL